MKLICVVVWTSGFLDGPPPPEAIVPDAKCVEYGRQAGYISRPTYLWYEPESNHYWIPGTEPRW